MVYSAGSMTTVSEACQWFGCPVPRVAGTILIVVIRGGDLTPSGGRPPLAAGGKKGRIRRPRKLSSYARPSKPGAGGGHRSPPFPAPLGQPRARSLSFRNFQ